VCMYLLSCSSSQYLQFRCLLGSEPQKNNMLGVVIASSSTHGAIE
jgi:hypothetical protein